jgi:MFS family permease
MAMRPEVPRRAGIFYGWYVAAGAVLIYFFTNGLAVFVPQSLAPRLMESFDATAAEIGRTSLITFTVSACLAPVAGALVDRWGVLRVLRSGLLVLAASFGAYPFARTLPQLYALHAALGAGLALGGLLVNVVLLSRWFVVRRGLAVGALASGSSLAGAALPIIIAPLVADAALGWRYGYGALTLAFLLFALLPGFLVLREEPGVLGLNPDGAGAPPPGATGGARDGVTLERALRSRSLWCLALGSACLWFSIQAVTSQVTIFLEREAEFAPPRATGVFSLIFALSFFGKFLYGAASDWFAKRHVMLAASLTLLGGCLLLFDFSAGAPTLVTEPVRLTAFAVVFGLGFGGSFTMIQLTVVESFGQRDLGKILGVVIFVDALGGGIGPAVAGELATRTGSYLAPFAVVTGVAVFAVLNVLLIRPLQRG